MSNNANLYGFTTYSPVYSATMTENPPSKLEMLVIKAADYYKTNPTFTVTLYSHSRENPQTYETAARFTIIDENLRYNQPALKELLAQAETQYKKQYVPRRRGKGQEATHERLATIVANIMPVYCAGMLGLNKKS